LSTGKTSYLLTTMKDYLKAGYHPNGLLFTTFTRSAAYHGRDRIIEEFPEYKAGDFRAGTIHSICLHLLGLPPQQLFVNRRIREFAKAFNYQLTQEDDSSLEQNIQDFALNTDADYFEFFVNWQTNKMMGDFDAAYGEFMGNQVDMPDGFSKKRLAEYMGRRDMYKHENALWDFSDLILGCLKRGLYPKGMRVLLADEQQDNSALLSALIEKWVGKAEESYLVGDPYQSIFGWASGDPTLMLDFPSDEQTTLHQSHRCSRAVHDLARIIVENRFKTRYPDDDFTPTDTEGEVVRGRPKSFEDGSTFYLFRTRYLLNLAYDELMAKGIPFVTRKGKLSPLDDRKGSKKSAVKALYGLYSGQRVALLDLGRLIQYIPAKGFIEHGQKAKLEGYCLENSGAFVMASNLLMLGFTLKFVEALKSEPLGVLSQRDFPDSHKSYLLDVIDTHGPEILDKDIPLCLSTCHASKGLEADSVVLCPDYTAKPWRRLIGNDEEEHRLAYVAVTRARNRVVVLPPTKTKFYPI
jgi:superfamily I DNA/RNA helicase